MAFDGLYQLIQGNPCNAMTLQSVVERPHNGQHRQFCKLVDRGGDARGSLHEQRSTPMFQTLLGRVSSEAQE